MKKGLELKLFGIKNLVFIFDKVSSKHSSYLETYPRPGVTTREILSHTITLEGGRTINLSDSEIPRKGINIGDTILLMYNEHNGKKCKLIYGPIGRQRDRFAYAFN